MIKQLKNWVLIGGVLAGVPVFALSCGDQVSGVVNLTADLHCTNSNGLVVAASNTTINLNGFTISCAGSGFENSCQRVYSKPATVGYEGVKSVGFSNVTVNGPGLITGFTVGVHLINGVFLNVNNVGIEGPYTPEFSKNTRGDATGILVGLINCPPVRLYNGEVPLPLYSLTPVAFSLTNNYVADQGTGISIQFAACGNVSNNTVVRTAQGGSSLGGWGVEVLNSKSITLSKNNVMFNGTGNAMGGGVHVAAGSTSTTLTNNEINTNCGEGVYADNVSGNKISLNTAKSNGTYWGFSQCVFMSPGEYYDFAESGSVANTWTFDNHCNTQTQGNIPYGVCGM